jgi:hypothetical protein
MNQQDHYTIAQNTCKAFSYKLLGGRWVVLGGGLGGVGMA